jgi:hypothetical protein
MLLKSRVFGVFSAVWGDFSCGEKSKEKERLCEQSFLAIVTLLFISLTRVK